MSTSVLQRSFKSSLLLIAKNRKRGSWARSNAVTRHVEQHNGRLFGFSDAAGVIRTCYVGLAFAASLHTSRNKRRIRWESIVGGNRRAPALALQGFAKGELDFIQLASQPRCVVSFWRSKREGDAGRQHRRRLISSPITWSRMKQIHRRFPEHPCQFNYPLIPIR